MEVGPTEVDGAVVGARLPVGIPVGVCEGIGIIPSLSQSVRTHEM